MVLGTRAACSISWASTHDRTASPESLHKEGSMSIRLQKGQTINLDKEQHDLSMVTIGLGWNVKREVGGMVVALIDQRL